LSIVFLNGQRYSGLVWTFKLPPSKHRATNTWHARPVTGTYLTPAYGLLDEKG